jgi:hypothetical protein
VAGNYGLGLSCMQVWESEEFHEEQNGTEVLHEMHASLGMLY